MGIYAQKPTWVVCQLAAASVSLLFLFSCGSDAYKNPKMQQQPTANLKVSNSPVYEFGIRTIGSINELSLTVTNIGSARATEMAGSFGLSAAFSFKDGNYPGTDGTCADTLDLGMACTVVVIFSPPMATKFEAPLQITYNDALGKALSNEPLLKGQGN